MEKYNKIRVIGTGTFGSAWLVEIISSKQKYVIKEIIIKSLSEQDTKNALNEVKILSSMRHKNIIRYKETFTQDDKLCIAMEYASEGDLHVKIKTQNGSLLSEKVILSWFLQILLAIHYIHGSKILHRDLKTQNIFLSRNGVIKVGDFGIAKCLSSTTDQARTTVGTPYYMSPEICKKLPYDSKSDIWSLGVILYELSTLNHPFKAQDIGGLMLKIMSGSYAPIPRKYSVVIKDLILVLLQVDARNRPSAEQLLRVPAIKENLKFLIQEKRASTSSERKEVKSESKQAVMDRESSGKVIKKKNEVEKRNVSVTDSLMEMTLSPRFEFDAATRKRSTNTSIFEQDSAKRRDQRQSPPQENNEIDKIKTLHYHLRKQKLDSEKCIEERYEEEIRKLHYDIKENQNILREKKEPNVLVLSNESQKKVTEYFPSRKVSSSKEKSLSPLNAITKQKFMEQVNRQKNEKAMPQSEPRKEITNVDKDVIQKSRRRAYSTNTYKVRKPSEDHKTKQNIRNFRSTVAIGNLKVHDSKYCDLEAMKNDLENTLGVDSCLKMYNFIQSVDDKTSNQEIMQVAMELLGEKHLQLFPEILKLVRCEMKIYQCGNK